MILNMPCLKCGVQNVLELGNHRRILFLCPSCHVGTAFINGSIYNFRREFLRDMRKRHKLVIVGDIVGTSSHDRFSNVHMVVRGSGAPQKGSVLTEQYLGSLHKSLEGVSTLEDLLETLENPGEP